MSESKRESSLERRIIALEEMAMHTDLMLAKLNQVILDVQDRLDEQARQLGILKEQLSRQPMGETEERSFEDERPPHY